MSRSFSRNFLLEVSKGNVPGHASFFKVVESTVIGTSFSTLWDIATSFSWPTSGETWEIISDSVDDDGSPAGTGAQTVIITGLDTNYDFQTESITMNGTTAVTTTRTDWLRSGNIAVTLSGSSEFNVGTITLRVSGAGATRATILPSAARSFNGMYTSPAGKTVFILQVKAFTPKGEDTTIEPLIRSFGTNTWLSGGIVPTYQTQVGINYQSYPRFNEKTDLEWVAKSTNTPIVGSLAMELMEIDNTYIEVQGDGVIYGL